MRRLQRPQPRIALGLALRGIARAAIDISDGLLADLGHICERSGLAADIEIDRIPCAPFVKHLGNRRLIRDALLAGGDDYELCFTAPLRRRGHVESLPGRIGVPLTRIGTMRRGRGVRLFGSDGAELRVGQRGFDHFG